MPLDADSILRDGLVDLDNAETTAVSETRNGDGAVVLDIRKTGIMGIVAVMVCPDVPTAAADTLSGSIQASDHVSTDFKDVASYPTLFALVRRLRIVSTTGFVAADITGSITGTDTGDTGTLRWYDRALETVGGIGDILIELDAAGDAFDDVDEVITAGTTGVGAVNGVISSITQALSYGIYTVRFTTQKRYVRVSNTPSAGANWGKVLVGLTNHWPQFAGMQ